MSLLFQAPPPQTLPWRTNPLPFITNRSVPAVLPLTDMNRQLRARLPCASADRAIKGPMAATATELSPALFRNFRLYPIAYSLGSSSSPSRPNVLRIAIFVRSRICSPTKPSGGAAEESFQFRLEITPLTGPEFARALPHDDSQITCVPSQGEGHLANAWSDRPKAEHEECRPALSNRP